MMTQTWNRADLVVFLLASFLLTILPACGQAKSTEADSSEIRKVIAHFIDAFTRHDAHAWAMPLAEDGDFTNVTGLYLHGRKEFEARFTELFASRLKSAHRTATVRHIRFITADVAAVDAEWELVGSKASDGSENPVRKGLFNLVMTRQNGHWVFAVFEESEFAQAK